MKKFSKLLSLILATVMLLTSSSMAFAADIAISESLTLFGLNSTSVSQAVNSYFASRADYLLGRSSSNDWSVIGIVNDEAAHLTRYGEKGIVLTGTTVTVSDTQCYDTHAIATATETVTYTQNGAVSTEQVIHELTLYPNSENTPVVAADAYIEICSDFASCSYVAPSLQTLSTTSDAAGSGLCIVEVARNEIGTQETGENLTKYGEWFGLNGVDWCAIFVCWCAGHANVDSTIVPHNLAGTYTYQNFFRELDNYYLSQSYGGTYTPQAGDIIFIGTGMYAPTHVGIVEKVEDGTVYIIDGNWVNQVNYHSYALSASDVIAYAHPNYASTDHAYEWECDSSGHWQVCSICGYTTSVSQHQASATYSYNGTHHWKTCTSCGIQLTKTVHTTITTSSGTLKCKFCGCDDCASALSLGDHEDAAAVIDCCD